VAYFRFNVLYYTSADIIFFIKKPEIYIIFTAFSERFKFTGMRKMELKRAHYKEKNQYKRGDVVWFLEMLYVVYQFASIIISNT